MAQITQLPVMASIAAALGVLSHLTYFIRGEHHTYTIQYFQILFFGPPIASLGLYQFGSYSFSDAFTTVGAITGAFLGGLFTSMTIYRLFFHPLRKFPGPVGARISKFWHASHLAKRDNYKLYERLIKQYGPFVRIGPSDILIGDGEAMGIIHGPRSKCTKNSVYDANLPLLSLHQSRDRAEHDRRRRTWDKGFSMKALRGYESRVAKYTQMLVNQIRTFSGQPVDVSKWFNYYSFDVMGDLAFGKPFDMLQNGESHFAIKLLQEGQDGLGVIGAVPWFLYLMTRTPIISRGYWTFVNWCEKQAEERSKMEVAEPDIMSWLLDGEPMSTDPEVNRNWLAGDSRLIVVAGSDTTAATLTHAFYHLATDPSQVQRLREELASIGPRTEYQEADLKDLKHLNGVIDETLRLHPPVPGGLIRIAPPEGLQIKDTFIPGETGVLVSTSSVMKSPECFQHPNEFIPERWYSKPEMILEPNAFAPFSLGRYGCIGKNLAYMEIRAVIASLITKFDVSFAPGEDGSRLLNETKDCFTLVMAPLNLTFTPRSKA